MYQVFTAKLIHLFTAKVYQVFTANMLHLFTAKMYHPTPGRKLASKSK